ncbi:membrane protein [Mangrovibacter sp. MFB070]|uniref:HlyD family secretion protein n=1 Tax=Mangrovibacter sp. MFB070 TaxID=1224318 RepID=UPI0004D5D873|nr:HlyD family secretion protein [Mangrovibacter sp. MFB070]KEA53394.1 membrane protein [Mangrovibacter sp. MFB070]
METLLLLSYAALCVAVFKIFRIPLNKWTVPTAVLGGGVFLGLIVLIMNYNYPFSDIGKEAYRTIPIVSQVRGRVTDVPVTPNVMLHKGDVLFRIDPEPFQNRVDDLRAQIKDASQNALSLDSGLNQAKADLNKAIADRDQAKREYARYAQGHKKGAFSDQEVDTRLQTWKAAEATVAAEQAAVQQAQNSLNSVVDGENSKVASLMAQLRNAEFNLESTVVRAPSDGYVTMVGLRPGVMSTSLGMAPVMTFVPKEPGELPTYVAAFRQNSIQRIKPGYEAELLFPSIPGTVFHGEVLGVLPAMGEGQFQGQGRLLTTADLQGQGRVLVTVRATDPRLAQYDLPQGSQVEVAVYSGHFEELSLMRKILIRMKSWENYVFLDH